MSSKFQSVSGTPTRSSRPPLVFADRDRLGAYTEDPVAFPPDRVIYHTEKWVVIYDMYPKSSVHLLLLPRDKSKYRLHPLEAFGDDRFRAEVQEEVKKVKAMVASELRRRYGRYSAQEQRRIEAMDADPPPDELPSGRDWEKDVISGVHARPSMNHLHIHVLSVDRVSEFMNKKHHYNSFATPFLVSVDDLPLAPSDVRRHPGQEGYLERDLICWRCGQNFGNRFKKLNEHLDVEFDGWKRE